MEKLMPDYFRRFVAQRFIESVKELGKIAVVFMETEDDISDGLTGKLFVLSDSDDFQISRLQRRVDWIRMELCPHNYSRGLLGDVEVVGPEELLKIRQYSRSFQPAVCIADYSGNDYYRRWTRSLNGALN